MKLVEMKKVQLIFTRSGREYVTPAQVVEELEMELVASGGRVTLTEVAATLNIDLTHVETAARALIAKKGKHIHELAGQLIAEYYLDTVVEEINESLQEAGSVALVELAQRFSLPADFTRRAIEQRMGAGGVVDGYIEDGQLYTATFIQLHAARTRGIMRALTRPTPLRSLIQRHGLMESRLSKEIAALLKEGAIAGSLKGADDRAIYTPDLFGRAQHAGVDSFFATNGYVELKKVERLSVANPKAFLAAKYPTAMQLSSMALSEGMVSSVTMACEDALNANLFLNAQTILPSVLSSTEVAQVLAHAVSSANKAASGDGKPQLAVVADVWAVSSVFRSEAQTYLTQRLDAWMDDEEAKLAAAAAAATATTASESQSATAAPVASSASSAGASKKAAAADDDDDEPLKKGKGKHSKGKGKGKEDSDDEDEAPAAKSKDKKKRRKKGADSDSDADEPVVAKATKGKIRLPSAATAAMPAPLTRDRVLKWLKADWTTVVRNAQRGNAEVQAADAVTDEHTEQLMQALAAMLFPPLLALQKARNTARAAALAAAAGSSASSSAAGASSGPGSDALLRRQQLECFRTHVTELYEQIVLYQHAIEYLGGTVVGGDDKDKVAVAPAAVKVDKVLLGQLESHLSKTLCASLLDMLLRMEAFSSLTPSVQSGLAGMDTIISLATAPAAEDKDASAASKAASKFDINRTPLSAKEREGVLGALPKRASDALKSLSETLSKEPALFLDRLDASSRALDLTLRKLDKKSERSRVFALRKSLMSSLAVETKPAVVLHLTVLLLFAKVHSVVPHAPAKCIPSIRRSAHKRINS